MGGGGYASAPYGCRVDVHPPVHQGCLYTALTFARNAQRSADEVSSVIIKFRGLVFEFPHFILHLDFSKCAELVSPRCGRL